MKRKRKFHSEQGAAKRQRTETDPEVKGHPTWPLLRKFYPRVLTLRQYLALRLSQLSKKRQRHVLHYGTNHGGYSNSADESVVELLDGIIVGCFDRVEIDDIGPIERDLTIFSQQLSKSTASITPTQGALKQSEIVLFSMWRLFRKNESANKPSHLLCHGYQRYASEYNDGAEIVPGIYSNCRDQHAQALREGPWCALPSLLGKSAERIIVGLLIHCGIFEPIGNSTNLTQLSGTPLSDLKPLKAVQRIQHGSVSGETRQPSHGPQSVECGKNRSLSDVRFLRHRIFYAKPAFGAEGKVRFGLSRAHVLNRHCDIEDEKQTEHVMKYLFPRQFDLRNALTSDIDVKKTGQPFQDYMIRDEEIARSLSRWRERRPAGESTPDAGKPPLPKRLRGVAMSLVARLRKRHTKCSYATMLNYYCPRTLASGDIAAGSTCYASPISQVSAFCKTVTLRVFPADFFGAGEIMSHNLRSVLKSVDKFVRLRRYESFSLHDVLQGVKIQGIEWMAPDRADQASKMSNTDFAKRRELLAELLYYLFDSFLIPLIQGHFHVTESGVHGNQVFFFRHDVWKALSEPALISLKDSMLEPCKSAEVKQMLAKRALGVSKIRMLPKEQGMRPIINLRRRVQKKQDGEMILGRSINSLLTPAFSALNYEKTAQPDRLASALFSVEGMYPRLQAFKTSLEAQGSAGEPLYFAKVDVKACFDTIPQKRLMELARGILGADTYQVAKYARSKIVGGNNQETPNFGAKPSWKYLTKASTGSKPFDFAREVKADTAEGRTRTIYVNGVVQKSQDRKAILDLLEEHVECNLIKLGARFYRQKRGIPQGSIVSSLLCSFFYAELEREVLGFVNDGQSVLLRLIDDFLVISTERHVAERFMRAMHRGIPEFGVEVKTEKSRANFDIDIDGKDITRLPTETDFPYCGHAINTVTLNLSKDKERRRRSSILDSMSVEHSRIPGQTFYRKTMNAIKFQMQAMLLSTAYNSLPTVFSNLHHAFTEVARKTYYYIRSLPHAKQPSSSLAIGTVDDLIKLACVLMKRRKRTSKDVLPYECCVNQVQTRWLACTAFHEVFRRRQTKNGILLRWLEKELAIPGLQGQKSALEAAIAG